MIQFPSRNHELDDVLSQYAGLPLRHLDLTGFLQITDVGVTWIACMKQLQYLSLEGTKVTDMGVAKLADLADLRKLYLDKTSVTDAGISQLTGLTKLDTLSLSRTLITSKSLILLGDYELTGFTRNLRTLNLSQCHQVTNAGVRGLGGAINLTNLNLDHTGVTKQCAKITEGFPHLKPVRLLGIETRG
ncbi:hypothetical protein BX666DRAFT_41103 [Dichotomocladium elegans]|nr:hypothetical protein BX666DRAFT_41103 [Dichotomocladium elegans]